MEFRVLGPLEVVDAGRPVRVARTKERTLLALLLLRANTLVSRDRLVDELWGERAPASARHTLEAYVSRLRSALGGGEGEEVIESLADGYLIRVAPEQLDAARFERLLGEGEAALAAGAPDEADEKLRDALELWRGEVLADLVLEPVPAVEVERLEELRLIAYEARITAALALGEDGSLIADLHALVEQNPLRERLRGQLMLALYRAGRQAEALEIYAEGRRLLAQELGLDPCLELQELQGEILRHDPGLAELGHSTVRRASDPSTIGERPGRVRLGA